MQKNTYTLIHFSDLHLLTLKGTAWQELLNKRIYGLLSKLASNKGVTDCLPIFKSLKLELKKIQPDRLVFTGDLTHLSLEREFKQGKECLDQLSEYAKILFIPGNHDYYTSKMNPDCLKAFKDYMNTGPESFSKNKREPFPILEIDPPIALIGLDTSIPTPPFFAHGKIGPGQLKRLESILEYLEEKDLFRVLLMHHPPLSFLAPRRKGLLDSKQLMFYLKSHPVQMILHGHTHKQSLHTLFPDQDTRIFGVSSISALDQEAEKCSSINIFQIKKEEKNWQVRLIVKKYSKKAKSFVYFSEKKFFFHLNP